VADPGDLFDLAEELLNAGSEALDTIPDLLGTAYDGAPDRQLVSPGLPTIDCCEMLTTWVDPIGVGARSPSTDLPSTLVYQPTVNLMAIRCVPTGRIVGKQYVPPAASSITSATRQILADAWAIENHLFNMMNQDLLFTTCKPLGWNAASAQTPMGGCGGWRFSFAVALDGYSEDLTT